MSPAASGLRAFLSTAVAPAWMAVRRRWAAFLAIQVCGVLLVVAYYNLPSVRGALGVVAGAKAHAGLLFAVFGSILAGGVVPEIARTLAGDRRWTSERWRAFGHISLTFAINGVAVDLLYIYLAGVFGQGTGWATVAQKIVTDAFVFTPFISLPIFLFMVLLREEEWSARRFAGRFDRTLIPDRVIPILIPCWCYWIPLQACVYSLPLNLQYPFALVCIAAWSLVLVFVAKRLDRAEAA